MYFFVTVLYLGFNLVIEMLLISSCNPSRLPDKSCVLFQSRNRDAFDFKQVSPIPKNMMEHSFNLVIEMLLISSAFGADVSAGRIVVSIS